VSLNPAHGEVYYLIQHYVIKFVSDLLQISDFPWVLLFSPPIKHHRPSPIYLEFIDCFRCVVVMGNLTLIFVNYRNITVYIRLTYRRNMTVFVVSMEISQAVRGQNVWLNTHTNLTLILPSSIKSWHHHRSLISWTSDNLSIFR
jgi:hypothetical protein